MDIAFADEIGIFIVICLDDMTLYSKFDEEHLMHLRRVFEKCRKFGISLNPKKSFFSLDQGKLLGFIVSKDGIYINPNKIKEISDIPLPHNKK